VDAIVTDSRDGPVRDLTGADFRVLLDGKPQEIKFCNFIQAGVRASGAAPQPLPAPVSKKLHAAQPAMPGVSIKREEVRRTIVLYVDDLAMSSESIPGIRRGLRKFVEEQVEPGDLGHSAAHDA
jgi:hypothetical protein